jgi:predicted outer membrane protein
MYPENDPGSPVQKPAWKSFETWASVVLIALGALLEAGVFADGSPVAKTIGAVLAIAGALGITASRTALKMSGNKAAAHVEAAKVMAEKLPLSRP